jgi:hypothetical protein
VEVRAALPPAAAPAHGRNDREQPAVLPLDEYLRRRSETSRR